VALNLCCVCCESSHPRQSPHRPHGGKILCHPCHVPLWPLRILCMRALKTNLQCRPLKTCKSLCPCGDRSCPDKTGKTCGCIPGVQTEACVNWQTLRVVNALPDCCLNTDPLAPVPNIKFDKKAWDEFNDKYRNGNRRYGTCPKSPLHTCTRAHPRGCQWDKCTYKPRLKDDEHPEATIGHRKTCWCYQEGTCVDTVNRDGYRCNPDSQAGQNNCTMGYCSRGGGFVQATQGTAPVFWGDCICRNATDEEWKTSKNVYVDSSQAVVNGTRRLARGVAFKWTFWDSNPCPYKKSKGSPGQVPNYGVSWSGPDCRLVRPPFLKYMMGWGDTRAGQLSRQLETLQSPDDQPQNLFRPTQIKSLDGVDLIAVDAGDFHGAAIAASQPHAVCNLSHVDDESTGVSEERGGFGPDHVLGNPFQCDGNILYSWGGNTEGELGHGYISESTAFDCLGIGNVRIPCENMGGALKATRLAKMIGRNVTQVNAGFKHTNVVLGDCPDTSKDRCGFCFGTNRDCVGCSGITNKMLKNDWCGECDGNGNTCAGCSKDYKCSSAADVCRDAAGAEMKCLGPVPHAYHPCHQGHAKGETCCLDVQGNPSTPTISDPSKQEKGKAAGIGPVPCSHFGVTSWRDRARAGLNYCGLTYDTCDVCDGDHTRCNDCFGVNHGKLSIDVCEKCGGLSTSCVGCDGRPDPNDARRAKYDACELCAGNNGTCRWVWPDLARAASPCSACSLAYSGSWPSCLCCMRATSDMRVSCAHCAVSCSWYLIVRQRQQQQQRVTGCCGCSLWPSVCLCEGPSASPSSLGT
jgi:hypothetical protein